MCTYYRKRYTCGCISALQIKRCTTRALNRETCTDIKHLGDDYILSYFPCFDCLRCDALQELADALETKLLNEPNPTIRDEIRHELERVQGEKAKSEWVRQDTIKQLQLRRKAEDENLRTMVPMVNEVKSEVDKCSNDEDMKKMEIDEAADDKDGGTVTGDVAKTSVHVASLKTMGPLSAPPAPGHGFGVSKMTLFGREVEAPEKNANDNVVILEDSGGVGEKSVAKVRMEGGENGGDSKSQGSKGINGRARNNINRRNKVNGNGSPDKAVNRGATHRGIHGDGQVNQNVKELTNFDLSSSAKSSPKSSPKHIFKGGSTASPRAGANGSPKASVGDGNSSPKINLNSRIKGNTNPRPEGHTNNLRTPIKNASKYATSWRKD